MKMAEFKPTGSDTIYVSVPALNCNGCAFDSGMPFTMTPECQESPGCSTSSDNGAVIWIAKPEAVLSTVTGKNPLDDDQYDGNDEQIKDLKEALSTALMLIHRLNNVAASSIGHGGSSLHVEVMQFVASLNE